MIVDSHCHAWEYWPYQPPVPDPQSRGLVEQLLYEMDRNGVDRAVLVAARIDHNPDNNRYVAEAVRRYRERLYQFADVDCSWTADYHTKGAADRLAETSRQFPLHGMTHYVKRDNDGWFRTDDGMAFFEVADERNLIASLAASPAWQSDIRKIARAFPTMPILCHHLAATRPASGASKEALDIVLESAECPNIFVKVSGFYYGAATPWDYPYEAVLPAVRQLYHRFGGSRLLWGSDYPVSRPHMSYRQTVEVVRDKCSFFSPSDRDRVMGDNLATLLANAGNVG